MASLTIIAWGQASAPRPWVVQCVLLLIGMSHSGMQEFRLFCEIQGLSGKLCLGHFGIVGDLMADTEVHKYTATISLTSAE